MCGFKIVQTTEKGSQRLFIIPSAWECMGLLRYPKKKDHYKLVKNENSKPHSEWPVMSCIVKRKGFPTYEDADVELATMLQNSDTDVGFVNQGVREENQADNTNFNDMVSQLMLHSQVDLVPTPSTTSTITTEQMTGDTFYILNDIDENLATTSSQNQPDMVMHKINAILSNQKDILEIQKRFAQRLGNFVIEIETKVEKTIKRVLNCHLNQKVTSLAEVRGTPENTAFKLKPIDSIADLDEIEFLLSDPVEKHKLMQLYSVLCTASVGHGITCAYKLIDILFTREFLCKCSWSGGSRGEKIKIALKGYKNLLDFFFRMVLFWDKSFTIDANEKFFKVVLRNAEQRKNIKNLRKPAMRKRTRTLKTQSENFEKTKRVDGELAEPSEKTEKDEGEMVEEKEEESEKNLEEDVEKDIEDEVVKDLEEEPEKNLEEEVEEDVDDKVKKFLERVTGKGKQKNVEEDISNKIESVSQNVGYKNRENYCRKIENFKAVKNVRARDNDNQLRQMPPKINQRDRPESYNKLENTRTATKIKAVDSNYQSVTPLKKPKQNH